VCHAFTQRDFVAINCFEWFRRRLKTLGDIRRYLAGLINRTESGAVEPALSGRLGYLANSLARIIETSDLEKRIAELEERIDSD